MRQSQVFPKPLRDAPKDEESKNAQLLIQAGFVHKEMAGVYAMLPLGLRVLEKINTVIREEMVRIGGSELHLTALQEKELWETTNRWSDDVVDNWFKTQLKDGRELGLGFTHEEQLTRLVSQFVQSYKDLPLALFQIQTKFRNELRAKSGILRGREFLMKDLYSFHVDEGSHNEFYEAAKQAYTTVFQRLGLGAQTFVTFASGGSFSKYSHEFQTLCSAGEDVIYVSREKGIAVNKEVYTDEVLAELGLSKDELEEEKAIEVGNIFHLGTKFSEPIGLTVSAEDGSSVPVIMGSYGIGPGRVMGTIVETYNDEHGIIWPKEVAPFGVHLVSLCREQEEISQADALYEKLQQQGIEVLYDDRADARPGEKFADSDLIGIPLRLVISPRSIENGGVEWKERAGGERTIVSLGEVSEKVVAFLA